VTMGWLRTKAGPQRLRFRPSSSSSSVRPPPFFLSPGGRQGSIASRRRRRQPSRLPSFLPSFLMETSLRLRGGGGLRIHAKEKLPLGHNSLLQAGPPLLFLLPRLRLYHLIRYPRPARLMGRWTPPELPPPQATSLSLSGNSTPRLL
jgi:hypothetical protein